MGSQCVHPTRGFNARLRAWPWGLPPAFSRVVGLPWAEAAPQGIRPGKGLPQELALAGGAWARGSPRSLLGSCRAEGDGGPGAARARPTAPSQGTGMAHEGGQGQSQPRAAWDVLGAPTAPHTSGCPSRPCWIQLLPLPLAPMPVTQPSPFGSSGPLLKTPLCRGADRNRERNAWEAFGTRALCLCSGGIRPPHQATTALPASPQGTPEN